APHPAEIAERRATVSTICGGQYHRVHRQDDLWVGHYGGGHVFLLRRRSEDDGKRDAAYAARSQLRARTADRIRSHQPRGGGGHAAVGRGARFTRRHWLCRGGNGMGLLAHAVDDRLRNDSVFWRGRGVGASLPMAVLLRR